MNNIVYTSRRKSYELVSYQMKLYLSSVEKSVKSVKSYYIILFSPNISRRKASRTHIIFNHIIFNYMKSVKCSLYKQEEIRHIK